MLDYMLVECAVSNRSMGKLFRVPYKNVLAEGQDPEFANAELYIEILVKWDAKHPPQKHELPEPDKNRH